MPHTPRPRPPASGRRAGFTLVETALCGTVAAVLVAILAPGFVQARERHRLLALAAQLATDLQWARSLAVARGTSVRITFEAGLGAGCYVIHTGPASACHCGDSGAAACTSAGQALQVFRLPLASSVQLSSNTRSMLFDARQGTVTPTGTVTISGSAGTIRQIVNILGRVRSCSPGGLVSGYRDC
jgi:type IV fimbrial biogenesis protein FimT